MHESVLHDFFIGDVSAPTLAEDLRGATVSDGSCVERHPIVDMTGDCTVLPSHLATICDAFLERHLVSDDLSAIGFCLIASDAFEWDTDTTDGERVAEVCNHWSSPEINFPINADNVVKWRAYLLTGVDQLRSGDA